MLRSPQRRAAECTVLMARVIVEGFVDPTRHNLWPLALIVTLVLGFAVAGAGAVFGWLASRWLRRG